MFWKKRDDPTLDKVLEILKIVQSELSRHDAEIDMLKARFKSKLHKIKTPPEETEAIETTKYNDGFDELRRLNKDGD